MNLLALFLLPQVMQPLPAVIPFWDINQREQRETITWQRDIKGMDIEAVNNYWNHRIKYELNDKQWSSPQETYERGTGDCKDYAVLKYYSLRDIGISADRLRFTLVVWRDELHAVLVVDDMVLDSMTDKIERVKDVNYYEAAYSVNEDNMWTVTEVH